MMTGSDELPQRRLNFLEKQLNRDSETGNDSVLKTTAPSFSILAGRRVTERAMRMKIFLRDHSN
jgi:hypothetical protein